MGKDHLVQGKKKVSKLRGVEADRQSDPSPEPQFGRGSQSLTGRVMPFLATSQRTMETSSQTPLPEETAGLLIC